MSKLYTTRTIAEKQVSENIIEAIISIKDYIENNSCIILQDIKDDEVNLEVDLVITDMVNSNNDNLILKIMDTLQNIDLISEAVELVSALSSAKEDGFDNLRVYI
ncbi:hypothetical protein [Aliarcobacter butzleri]|uniref:hypothetical protein n=1 Tax=Aliarcobacter butzleri TaxID=28197 RepID=UPI001269A78B|nr:hypothetical protein [Aliarcobacter butzleri]